MATKLHPNIGLIDREARRAGIDLTEQSVNKRSFEYGEQKWEMTPNGDLIQLKQYLREVDGTSWTLDTVENAPVDHVIGALKALNEPTRREVQ